MVFSSALFMFIFFPVTLLGYYLINDKLKNIWLLVASIFFYAWGEPKYIILMLISIIINYFAGITIERFSSYKTVTKVLMIFICVIDLGMLFIFKYLDFGIQNFNMVFGSSIALKGIALPIGISFYTFQVLSYVIDVYRNDIEAQKNIINLGLYITMFPQLIAGPIVRYADIEKQLTNRSYGWGCLSTGFSRFIIGFGKKVLIADGLSVVADFTFNTNSSSSILAWIGILAYSMQIYYDFSGYSDMAIGLGKMFGFDFIDNFNYPYISKSIQEFWRRWHISLGTWFKDYVYISLGGNRGGKWKTYRNLGVVFLLTGIWHGASWNFVLWGVWYAIFLILERIFLKKALEKIPIFFSHLYTLFIVLIGWVLFRASDLMGALKYIKTMFSFNFDLRDVMINISIEHVILLILSVIFSMPIAQYVSEKVQNKVVLNIGHIILFSISLIYMVSRGFSAFLYFRF